MTSVPSTTTTMQAREIQAGQTVRILFGPKAGLTGVVEQVRRADQWQTNFAMTIIDFVGGARSTRRSDEAVEVLS